MTKDATKTGIKTGKKAVTSSGHTYQRTPDGVRISDPSGNTVAEHNSDDFLAALAAIGVGSPQDSTDLNMSDDWQDGDDLGGDERN